MKILHLVLFFLFTHSLIAEIIQNDGPFYECENIYFDATQEILAFSSNEETLLQSSLWQSIPTSSSLFKKTENCLSKKSHHWQGTTLLLVDSCRGFLTHYFHFLEHLIGIWQFGGEEQALNVRNIVFCSENKKDEDFKWKGLNQINKKIIGILFPHARVHTLAKLKRRKTSILCDQMIISSRITSYGLPSCASINKMLGASMPNISPFKLEALRQKILSGLNISSLPVTRSPRITYIVRQPPRKLTDTLENSLVHSIKNRLGIDVHKVDFATLSFEKQLQIIANTDVLIGVHGNGLTHLLFLPPSATVIELFPSTGFTWDYQLLAKIRHLNYYGHFNGDWVTNEENPHQSRFLCHGNLTSPVNTLDIETVIEILKEHCNKPL